MVFKSYYSENQTTLSYYLHCKKLEVDLTQENVISVALWIRLGPGSGPPPVAMVKGYTPFPVKDSHELGNSFCNCKKGVELCHIHILLGEL